MNYINRTYIIAMTAAFFILNGCVTKDLEPIGGPILEGVPRGTASDTATAIEPQPDSGSTNTDIDGTASTDSNTEASPDTESTTLSDFETDTHYTIADTGTETGTGSGDDTVNDTASDSQSESDTATEADTETDTETSSDTGPAVAKKWIGSATQDGGYPPDFFSLWNQVTPENAGKWGEIEAERDVMDWEAHDILYQEAVEQGAVFKGHTLIWHLQQPAWLDALPEYEQREEVEEWIAAFCERYPDIELINVATAPFHDPPPYAAALGGVGGTGYDWAVTAFEMARTHCPNAKLLVEEYSALIWNTAQVVNFAKILTDRGLLDGIGCEAGSLIGMPKADLIANLDSLMDLEVPIYIAGLAIDHANDDTQLNLMKEFFPVFYLNPMVAGITFWGYVEGFTHRRDAYLRRADGSPRKALTWLQDEGYLVSTGE